jgi:hypothetical protein
MESTSIVVLIPSSVPPILTIPNLVLDVLLVGKGATKGSKTNWGKLGHKQLIKVSTIFCLFNNWRSFRSKL